jgi:predicted nucleotidyltransferase
MSGSQKGLGIEQYRQLLDLFLTRTESVLGRAIRSVVLFGSIARGEGGPQSDIDLFVVYGGSRRKVTECLTEIVLEIRNTQEYKDLLEKGIRAEIYPFLISEKRLEDTLWILLDASDHGVVLQDTRDLFGRKLRSIRERVRDIGGTRISLPNSRWYWVLTEDFECLTKEGVAL